MMKRQIKLLIGVASLLVSLITVSSVYAQSFDQVFEWIKRFQKGEEVELKIQVGTESFTFFRSKQTNIDQSIFNQLRKNTSGQRIKILPDPANKKLEGLVIEYQVDKLLRLEETWKGNSPSAWRKIEFIKIASYPLARWPDFIKQAIPHGLMEYEVIEYKGESLASLTFKQTDPPSIQFGRRSLKFSDEFYEYMKISREFKPHTGNSDKIVVLVHEPHWLLVGQYQLIPGLKAFLEANSQYKFRFLVEGDWEEEIKYIPTKPTLNRFSKSVSKVSQVFSLLRNFLIDGPFAYRLLYNPDLPALAIDDSKTIKETPREPDFKDWIEQRKVFMKIYEKLEKFPEKQRIEASRILVILIYYVMADVQNLKGEAFIDYSQQMSGLYNALLNQLSSLSTQNFNEEKFFLKNQAESFQTQVTILQKALKRDDVMAKGIENHFKEKAYSNRIPIVFIGNFHTPGIIDRLPKGISYVVIEPRVTPLSLIPPQRERDNFNDALKPETRLNYLRRLGGSLLKGQVAPLERELPYYKSFLEREAQRIITRRNAFITSSPLGSDVTSRINNVLEQNGILNNAQVEFAGRAQSPPPPFQEAFASFFYEGEDPKMIIYDRNEDNWRRSDRINYLKKVVFIPPYEKVQRETRKVLFYQDRETNRIFFWVFNPVDQRFYLYEWKEGMDIFNLLPPLKDSHIKTAVRKLLYYEEERLHG